MSHYRQDNLLSTLHKWASGQDENFVTDAFAHLLRHLLAHEPTAAVSLLKRLSDGFLQLSAEQAGTVRVATQVTTPHGRPDMEIRTPDQLMYVEAKVGSVVGQAQLARYRAALESSGVNRTCLIYLSRYPESLDPAHGLPDYHARWVQVAEWLDHLLSDEVIREPTSRFLARQFVEFLQQLGIAMQQVRPELPTGIRAMEHLLLLIGEALSSLVLPAKQGAGWEYKGFYVDGKRYWVGLYYEDPESLVFETQEFHFNRDEPERRGLGGTIKQYWGKWPHKWVITFDLSPDNVAFYKAPASEQMKQVRSFIAESLTKAKSIEVPDEP